VAANPVVPTIPDITASSSSVGQGSGQTKLFNRTIFITPTGTLHPSASYNKLHLFDFGSLKESAHTQAGGELLAPISTPVGTLGSLICFDLRFPECSLRLSHPGPAHPFPPAQILAYPSAFTVATGRAHWEVLLRARAIESQSWVIAAAQVGTHHDDGKGRKRISYGHSIAVDPWGRVVCRLGGVREDDTVDPGAEDELGIVDIDLAEWEKVRRDMPLIRRT
jgi:predicted amidohydrolase